MYRMRTNNRPQTLIRPAGREARARIHRELHGGFIKVTAGLKRAPSDAWYDMRRKRERWWGNLVRHTDELIDAGVPREQIEMLPDIWKAYIREECVDRDTRSLTMEPKRAA